jgi:hypothetical protein
MLRHAMRKSSFCITLLAACFMPILTTAGCAKHTQQASESARTGKAQFNCEHSEPVAASKASTQPAAWMQLRDSIEAGPLYAAASVSGVEQCAAEEAQPGSLVLKYQFRDGSVLRAQRNEAIELTEQDATFASPLRSHRDLATLVERAAFGEGGCGIDWRHPEVQPMSADAKTIDEVFRGTLCNCQVRIGRNAHGEVVRLLFRSSC